MFRALDSNGSGRVAFEDFARVAFQTDNMVIDSHDHKKQRAADRASALAINAAALGRIATGVELLRTFSRKMEGQPNVSAAFNKFRRLGGSSDGSLTRPQFDAAMVKWGMNATKVRACVRGHRAPLSRVCVRSSCKASLL